MLRQAAYERRATDRSEEEVASAIDQESATGESIAVSIKDILLSLGLSLTQLRAPTYVGASMAGQFKGGQPTGFEPTTFVTVGRCANHYTSRTDERMGA